MIRVPRRVIRPNPVPTDTYDLGPTRNRLHVARSRANILGLGGEESANWTNHFAEKEAVPQMINRAHNTLKTNPFLMNVFFKLRAGRRCSCWGKGETPDGYCVSCYKAGYVIGYEKFKCKTELIDCTHPDISLVNILPDYASGKVPVPLSLTSKATFGVFEVPVKLTPNVGILDLFKVHTSTPKGTSIQVKVRKSVETTYVPANAENVAARLNGGVLFFRVEMWRESLKTSAPYLKAIRLRYQVQGTKPEDVLVPLNIPMGEESFQLQDLGIWESFQTLSFFGDNTLRAIKNEDFLHNPRDNRRFMVINAKLFDPTNTVVSWFLNARFIQSELDAVNEFPIGGDK